MAKLPDENNVVDIQANKFKNKHKVLTAGSAARFFEFPEDARSREINYRLSAEQRSMLTGALKKTALVTKHIKSIKKLGLSHPLYNQEVSPKVRRRLHLAVRYDVKSCMLFVPDNEPVDLTNAPHCQVLCEVLFVRLPRRELKNSIDYRDLIDRYEGLFSKRKITKKDWNKVKRSRLYINQILGTHDLFLPGRGIRLNQRHLYLTS